MKESQISLIFAMLFLILSHWTTGVTHAIQLVGALVNALFAGWYMLNGE
jgi:hypothetical protein